MPSGPGSDVDEPNPHHYFICRTENIGILLIELVETLARIDCAEALPYCGNRWAQITEDIVQSNHASNISNDLIVSKATVLRMIAVYQDQIPPFFVEQRFCVGAFAVAII